MVKSKKIVTVLAAISLFGLAAVGCSNNSTSSSTTPANSSTTTTTTTADQPVDGGTLTFGSFSDIVSLNPIYIADTASGDAANFVFANLFDFTRDGIPTVEPWSLAAALPEVSADNLTYTIKLKPEAKWSDGVSVTSDDIIYTINTIKNPAAASPGIGSFDKVDTMEKVDDQTVKITLKQVYAPFLDVLVMNLAPYHILKDVSLSDLKNNTYGTDPTKTVTNGPWTWSNWTQGQSLTFTKDPNYWGQQPHIDTVNYKIYADQNTEVQALIKGDIDLLEAIPVTSLDAVKQKQDISVLLAPGPLYEFLAFNFKADNFTDNYPLFTGEKTRQAIATALDRQGMIDNVLKGTGTLINGPFLPGTWADPGSNMTQYNYNVDAAKKLLADDGWVAGSDGILTKDGHRFSFELQYNSGNSRRQAVSTIIQQNLQAVGIEVTTKAIDFASWNEQNLTPGKFQAVLLAWSLNNPDPDGEQTFSSKYYTPTGQNIGFYKDTDLDKLWVEGYSTLDQDKRKAVYDQIGKIISVDLPYAFLYQYGQPEGLDARIKFAQDDAPQASLPYGYFHNIINWWVTQ